MTYAGWVCYIPCKHIHKATRVYSWYYAAWFYPYCCNKTYTIYLRKGVGRGSAPAYMVVRYTLAYPVDMYTS